MVSFPAEPRRGGGEERFHVAAPEAPVVVSPVGDAVPVVLPVRNTSTIVDGYVARALDAPDWLRIESSQAELLPGGTGEVTVRLRALSAAIVPAQQRPVVLRVWTTSHNPVYQDVPILVVVPVIDVPPRLEVEPRVIRVRDSATGEFVLGLRNPSNRPVRLTVAATDLESVVQVQFERSVVELGPGGSAALRARISAPVPGPGQEVSRQVTLTAAEGERTVIATMTFIQMAGVSPMVTLAVRIEPSVLPLRDSDSAVAQVVLDNRQGATGVRLGLQGTDPEQAVRFSWSQTVVDVGPGQVVSVPVRLGAWRPDPGQEVTRPFTVTASDGRTSVSASGSLHQVASRSAIELLTVRLSPSTLRLANRRQGELTATVDNRRGRQPVQIGLRGQDPEGALAFEIHPATLSLPPGQSASVAVRIRTPGAVPGREVVHPFSVVATDGRTEVPALGNVIQTATSRRPLARFLCTVLGALLVLVGASLAWNDDPESGFGLTLDELLDPFGLTIEPFLEELPPALLAPANGVLSAGGALAVLAVVAVFGLTGRTGRLTRLAALLGVVVLAGVAISVVAGDPSVDLTVGIPLVILGLVAVYIGGHLAPK